MFGPKPPRRLIFEKTKKWWELLHKLHLPEERRKLNDLELIDIAKQMSELRISIRNLELENRVDLGDMVDFDRLTEFFFRDRKFSYGKPIVDIRKRIRDI